MPGALLTIAGNARALCIGTWAWSPSATWGKVAESNTDETTNRLAFRAAIEAGCPFFDTAEVYGESEARIGRYMASLPEAEHSRVAIASKYIPMPWHVSQSNVV
jgi:aryl-alcohol dehydrogenase-like predicted oxidoreductase